MMKRIVSLLLTIVLLASLATLSLADEGMWTFDNPPRKLWKERYNFEPSDAWLEHVRLASVKVGTASGAFVSRRGLVMTNQHVASSQIAKLSTPERNLTRDGFYARTQAEELKCPDMEIDVLVSYEDVTKRVQGAVKQGSSVAEANEQRRAEIALVESESKQKTGLVSNVVMFYSGGEYWLYRFKRYTDVRLVFAPEEQIAFFGGDYDNFTYPRYCLDVTFLRVYENGQPAATENFFKWSKAGPADGEFVVLSGAPGSTDRLMTVAQLKYQRDVGNPLQMQVWTARRNALERYSAQGAEQARRAGASLRSVSNSIKRLTGQQEGLMNPRMFATKEEQERALRSEVSRRPELQKEFGAAWEDVATAYNELPAMAKRISFSTIEAARLGSIATSIVRYSEEVPKPSGQRYAEYRDNRLESLRLNLFSSAPIYTEMDEAVLAAWLEEARKTLGSEDPFIRAALEGQTPAEVARRVIGGTKLADVAVRRALIEGGKEAVAKSDDPLIVLARKVEPIVRELRAWNETRIRSVEASAGQKISAARFAVYGKSIYPDANSNLRLSYGKVLGYEEDTTLVPYKTTFYGLYNRAEGFGEKSPFDLPARFREKKNQLDLSTPLNFVYTADTIGGNSGSPIINRNAEIVGLNFDSNLQKLPNRYWYVDETEGGRAVAVHSLAITEALRKMYGANELVAEITGQ
ncbi:MAG TPA: S46 family peptidase [Pyrinomonadaceae bacterium]|nr:S46 family peptidase [Pyrinomonadaceae bacterium]